MNNYLIYFYSLNPYLAAFFIFLFGFGTLLLVGIKTKTVKTILFKNPAILIGDVLLLPLSGFLTTTIVQKTDSLSVFNQSPIVSFTIAGIAILLTLFSALRFQLLHLWWIPHGVFYWFMSYLILDFVVMEIVVLITQTYDIVISLGLIFIVVLISLHLYLGKKFPKKFPTP